MQFQQMQKLQGSKLIESNQSLNQNSLKSTKQNFLQKYCLMPYIVINLKIMSKNYYYASKINQKAIFSLSYQLIIQRYMQLNILDTEKTTVSIQCTSSDTVGLIKKKIADKKGLTDYFILKIAGMSMRDQNTLSNYFITGEQTLVMAEDNTAEEQGPECFSDFNFNSLQNKQKRQFSKDAPAWRIVCPGLNIQARCKNSSCKAYNKPTWVQKGYGNFNIGYQIFNCECPICKQQTHQGFNLSYYQTKITIKGKRKNEQRKFKIEQTVKQNQLSTFAHSDDEMRQWNYLIVEAKKV